jgi:hypothetical protein
MNQNGEISTRDPLDEFLYRCQLLAEPFDESERWHYFGNRESWIPEQVRPMYREGAKWRAYDRVATHRITKDKIARHFDELEIPDVEEDRIRIETLRELNDLWHEIIMTHQLM